MNWINEDVHFTLMDGKFIWINMTFLFSHHLIKHWVRSQSLWWPQVHSEILTAESKSNFKRFCLGHLAEQTHISWSSLYITSIYGFHILSVFYSILSLAPLFSGAADYNMKSLDPFTAHWTLPVKFNTVFLFNVPLPCDRSARQLLWSVVSTKFIYLFFFFNASFLFL